MRLGKSELDLWGGRPPPRGIFLTALGLATLMAVPLFYIAYRGIFAGSAVWADLWSERLPGLLLKTLALAASVTISSVALGVPLAWLVTRAQIPHRRVWTVLLAMPMVVPPYIGALSYISVLGYGGFLRNALARGIGVNPATLPSIYGFFGATFILALFTYPYVYLLTSAALRGINRSYEEAARVSGLDQRSLVRRVILPLVRPAIGAGALLSALYVLSDFGTVTLMRYETFNLAIYMQLSSRIDRSAAAALSAVLVTLAFATLLSEEWLRGRASYEQTRGTWRPIEPVNLGRWRLPALGFMSAVSLAAIVLPLGLLVFWTLQGMLDTSEGASLWSTPFYGLLQYTWNSLYTAITAATIATAIGIPLAYMYIRHKGPLSAALFNASRVGYALSGVVLALSLIFIFNAYLPWVYGTVAMVVIAYIVRFMPQALQATQSSLLQVSASLEEASRMLGSGTVRTMRLVTMPLISNGLVTAWVMVFLTSLKELAATLILSPPGFATLPMRVWSAASEGLYTQAAPAALVLMACALIPLYVIIIRGRLGFTTVAT